MATTQNTFTGNGSNLGPFSFTFKWLESTDIKVSVGGVLKTAGTHYNLQSLNYTTKTGGQVLFTAGNAPANGASIRIFRDTDDDALSAVFSSGSAIRAKDLNDNFTQNLYVTQEINNNAVSIDGSNPMVSDFNMNGYKITNLAAPVAGTDAANRSFVEGVFSSEVPYFYRRWSKTAVGGETSLSGNDNSGIALSYVPGSEKVFINGALQVRGVDYTGTTGTTLTAISALTAGDIVEVHSSSNYLVGTVPDGSVTNAKVDGGAAIQSTKLAFTQAGTGATTRTVESKLRDVVSVKDFGAVGDGVADDTAAIQAAIDSPTRTIIFPGGTYLISSTLTITSNKKSLICTAFRGAEIVLSGAADYLIDIGSASGMTYDSKLENLVLSRESVRTSGAAVRYRNHTYFDIVNCRLYLDNKFQRGIEVYACFNGRFSELFIEQPIAEHIYVSGGTNAGGTLDGKSVQNYFYEVELTGGNAGLSAATSGCLVLADNCEATLIRSLRCYGHTGYAVYGKGSGSSLTNNQLNLIYDINVEASSGKTAGVVKLDYYRGTTIAQGWGSSNDIPAIVLSANTNNTRVSGIQLGIAGAGSYGLEDSGSQNSFESLDIQQYGSGAGGINLTATCTNAYGSQVTFRNLSGNAIDCAVPSNNALTLRGIYYLSCGGGLAGTLRNGGVHNIYDVRKMDSTNYLSTSATLTVDPGYEVYYVNGTSAISTITASYRGHVITLMLKDVGGTVNHGSGNIVLSNATNLVSNGRNSIRLEYDGSNWREVGRSA